jgi:hypothetical protein
VQAIRSGETKVGEPSACAIGGTSFEGWSYASLSLGFWTLQYQRLHSSSLLLFGR